MALVTLFTKGTNGHGDEQQKAFEQIKSDLKQAPVLVLYDPNEETKVAAYTSSFGLCGVILQLQPDNSW